MWKTLMAKIFGAECPLCEASNKAASLSSYSIECSRCGESYLIPRGDKQWNRS